MWRRKAIWGDKVAVERMEEERGENVYLDIQKRNEIRILLNILLEEKRGRLAR